MMEPEPSKVGGEACFGRCDAKVGETCNAQASTDCSSLNSCHYGRFAAEKVESCVIKMTWGAVGVFSCNLTAPGAVIMELSPCAEIFTFGAQNYRTAIVVFI